MTISSFAEKTAFQAALAVLGGLDPVRASNLGAAVAGRLGPPLPVSKVAERDLTLALPFLVREGRRDIVRMMWESLGRTVGELPHLAALTNSASGPGWASTWRAFIAHFQLCGRSGRFGLRREAIGADFPMFPKGTIGARRALAHLSRGGYLGMLVDQKMNDATPLSDEPGSWLWLHRRWPKTEALQTAA